MANQRPKVLSETALRGGPVQSSVSVLLRQGWLGFDDRIFLTEGEHQTYCRRMPVRYARKSLGRATGATCVVCGAGPMADNELQAAHIVPFKAGVIDFALTPEWLDGRHNLEWAHKKICNKKVELPHEAIASHLSEKFGLTVPRFNRRS